MCFLRDRNCGNAYVWIALDFLYRRMRRCQVILTITVVNVQDLYGITSIICITLKLILVYAIFWNTDIKLLSMTSFGVRYH